MSLAYSICLRFSAFVLVTTLAACADMGGIQPQAEVADTARLDPGAVLTAGNSAALSQVWTQEWWTAFGDEQLNQLVARALNGSPTVRIAQARIRQAQAAAGISMAGMFPAVKGDADLVRNHFTENEFVPPPYAGNSSWDNKILVEAAYGLDLWGRDRDLHESALDSERAVTDEKAVVRLSLQSAIVRTYLQLVLGYAQRDVLVAILDQQEKSLGISTERYKAGIGTQLDVSEAEELMPTTRALIVQSKANIAQQQIRIAALVGVGPGEAEQLSRPRLDLSLMLPLPDVIPAHWLGRRADLSALRWRIEATSKNIDAAKARFYPDIDLRAFAGFQSLDFSQLLSRESVLTGFGPAITLPIFSGGKLRAQLGASTASYDIAVESYNEALVNALAQAASRICAIHSVDEQLDNTQNALGAAKKAYELALGGFRAGFTEYVNVLSTQSRLLNEQRRISQLRAERLDAHAALIEALGGGIPVAGP